VSTGPGSPRRISPWLRLCRAGTLFSPAADVVAGACLAGLPWTLDLGRAAVASVLVYAAGMVLNDHADRREDARLRPERPIPSGEIAARTALLAGLALLAAAVAIAPWRAHWALLALGVLAYDYLGKRSLIVGAPLMGLLRAANLAGGAAFAAQSHALGEAVLLPALAYALYVLSVTVLGHYEDVPRIGRRAVVGVQSVPPLAALLALLALPERAPALALGLPLVAAFFARLRRVGAAWDRSSIRGSMTWLLLGTMLYTALLCVGSGRPYEAAGIALAVVPARWIGRRIALT
jgi:4-hydroxybenzoate polyprenyltransferase